MRQTSVINDLLNSIADTRLFGDRRRSKRASRDDLVGMIDTLLSRRDEASATREAEEFLRAYRDLGDEGRTALFRALASDYGAEPEALRTAAARYLDAPGHETAMEVRAAAEPRRMVLFRRLNRVQGGTQALVAMRLEILERLPGCPELAAVDEDLFRLFVDWFNRGFLELREIDWQTSAAVLEKIIRYEAVHAIRDWDDLRRRIDVPDRKLFAFFHPRLGDEPLIFVEVALSTDMPGAIGPILAETRETIDPRGATTAIFYSISNCQDGLRGISFGAFLIKQVADDLARALPNLKTFVTLSPMPGFRAWLEAEAARPFGAVDAATRALIATLDAPGALDDTVTAKQAEAALMPLAAHYLTNVRDSKGRLADPVARFHLGNGARLERLNFAADLSARGVAGAFGMMVNYRYVLNEVEKNHEAFMNDGKIAATAAVTRLARTVKPSESEPVTGPPRTSAANGASTRGEARP